jgi:carboxyl-terminal processing protease
MEEQLNPRNPRPRPTLFRRLRSWKGALVVVAVAFVTLGFIRPVRENYFEISKQLEILNSVFRELNIYYVDELQPGTLMDVAIESMVNSLDPYTVYYPESKVEDLRFITTGEYGGVGATIQDMQGQVTIVDVYPGFPAAEAGLRIGDVIVSVGGKKVAGLSTDQVSEMLQGATGTGLELKFRRPGESEDRFVALTREKIKMPAVPYRGMVDETTGYVILSAFTQGSAAELRQAIRFLTDSAGAQQIVLDLRATAGGRLNESVSIVNLFLQKDLDVVSTRGKVPEWTKVYRTFADPVVPDLPIAVLIDGVSASASEIVAGALQDHDRGIVVGETSYGKGLVQQNKDLAYGTKLKVTVAKYYTPSGRCIQRLDYSRKKDGIAAEVPDSLRREFRTKAGRKVLDGKGIEPDLEITPEYMSPVLEALYDKGTLFAFVNRWSTGRESIAGPKEFALSESDWSEFVDFVRSQPDHSYETLTFAAVQAVRDAAREEGTFDSDSTALLAFEAAVRPNLLKDLQRHRDQIQRALEEEIVMRYHLQEGVILWGMQDDPVLQAAVTSLSSGHYKTLLAGRK